MPPSRSTQLNEDAIARLKKKIGFSDEPVQDTEGYWTIGYGRRLNEKPGGARPDAVISEAMADEELRYRVASLAAMGRGGDTEIAHVALGELVLPTVLQTPDVMRALSVAAKHAGVTLDRLRIGMPQNSINPHTGAAEFGTFSNRTFGSNTEGGYEDDDKIGGYGGGPIEEITIYGNGPDSFVPNDMESFGRSIQHPGFGPVSDGGFGGYSSESAPALPEQQVALDIFTRQLITREMENNAKSVLSSLTNNSMSPSEINKVYDHVIRTIPLSAVTKFASIDTSRTPISLTYDQLGIVQGQIDQLPTDLRGRLQQQVLNSLNEGRIVIPPSP